jgi:predicted nuclease of predicted toxin-antitoxin system
VKFFFDEDVTPALPPICHERGYDATCARDRALLDVDDDDIVAFCFEEDFIVVTGNARDFRWLCGNVELHPGLIVMPSLLKEEQLKLFPRVIDYIEKQAAAENISPVTFMVNRVIEMAEDGNCTYYDLPQPEDS